MSTIGTCIQMLMEPLGDADMVRGSALPQKRQTLRIYLILLPNCSLLPVCEQKHY